MNIKPKASKITIKNKASHMISNLVSKTTLIKEDPKISFKKNKIYQIQKYKTKIQNLK